MIEYRANNSGGEWPLDDGHWKQLESAGWKVQWLERPFLGTPALTATREGLTLQDAETEWETTTGLDSSDPGCPCCGRPHKFSLIEEESNA